MPDSLVKRKSSRKNKYRAGKQVREKLTKICLAKKISGLNLQFVNFVVPKAPKAILEIQELESQKLTDQKQFSSFFEKLLNQAEANLFISKKISNLSLVVPESTEPN